jgi:shikimate kinase
MPIAILIGFHCTGKTSTRRELKNIIKDVVYDFVDTDFEICRDPKYDGIERIFLDLVRGSDRDAALNHIEQNEKEYLKGANLHEKPLLIAIGPAMPLHTEDWLQFVERAKAFDATIFHFTKKPELILQVLKRRQSSDAKKIINGARADQHPNFGSWNADILNGYNDATARWQPYSDDEQLSRITKLIAQRDVTYAQSADRTVDMSVSKNSNEFQMHLRAVAAAMGIG